MLYDNKNTEMKQEHIQTWGNISQTYDLCNSKSP